MKITKLGHCCLLVEVTSSILGKSPLPKGALHSDAGGLLQPPKAVPFVKGDSENKPVRIMTDPGAWTPLEATGQALPLTGRGTLRSEAMNIDYVFITHEHQDHFHVESLKTVLKNNPKAKIVTNQSVGKLLDVEKIPYELLEHGGAKEFSGVHVEGHGEKHEVIYESFGQVQNTGYFFANRFFYPGDAFYVPADLPVRGTQAGASAKEGNPNKPVEILALPVAGPWLKISEAIDYAKLLKPKICFPVHDGMLKFNQVTRMIPQKFLPPAGIEFVEILDGATREF